MKALTKILLIVLLSFYTLYASTITPREQAWLDQTKTLRVRITKDLPPYQFIQNGQYVGISVDYIKFFASMYHLNIQYVTDGTWAEAVERLKTRNGIDVILRAPTSTTCSETMLFTRPYCAFPFSLLLSNKLKADTFFDASLKKIAIVPNYTVLMKNYNAIIPIGRT